jgi:hypothetical protein
MLISQMSRIAIRRRKGRPFQAMLYVGREGDMIYGEAVLEEVDCR